MNQMRQHSQEHRGEQMRKRDREIITTSTSNSTPNASQSRWKNASSPCREPEESLYRN